jgi:nucleotide-binding universal stress UspA family protein
VFKHVLCPIDGSQTSLQTLDMAAKFAAEQHARLTIFNVIDPSKAAAMAFGDPLMSAACFDALEDDAQNVVRDAAARVQSTITADMAVQSGQTVDGIVQYAAAHGCDIIVMGSHGRSGIQRAFLGSVAEGVARHAAVPVLINRYAEKPAAIP